MFPQLALLALSFAVPTLAQEPSTKSVLFDDGLSPHVDDDLWTALPSQENEASVDQWTSGQIPDTCYTFIANEGGESYCSAYDVEVYNVTFSDVSPVLTTENHN